MLLDLTADQAFFQETTAKYLAQRVPIAELRRLHGEHREPDAGYWRQGAELGWTSLLVGEEAGGGTVSGRPALEFALVAYEFGRHVAPGPLVPVNAVAAALHDTDSHPQVLADLIAGTAVAAWCHAEPRAGLDQVGLDIRVEGAELVLNGRKSPVEAAGSARHFLVTGRVGGELTQVLVPADAAGVAVAELSTVDLTRRFGSVSFTDVRVPADAVVGAVGTAAPQVRRQLGLALLAQCAETLGAMQTGFEATTKWAFDRYSFGRPLASYQALKHRFADLKTTLEASHAIVGAAAAAVDDADDSAPELLSAAKAYIGAQGSELLQDCVQLHGGIGLTFEHDLHLFLRRATVNRALYGAPAEHRQRLAHIVIEREELK